ncbi:MAG: hypothetical protein ACFFEU_07760 [Candidatus Thorarchaeota archaeon]
MEVEERICKGCGARLDAGVKTCPKCGRLHVDSTKDRLGYEDRGTVGVHPKPSPVVGVAAISETSMELDEMEIEVAEHEFAEPVEEEIIPEVPIDVKQEGLSWPTEAMALTVNKLGFDEELAINKERPSGIEDLTLNEGEQIIEFAPDIDLLGFDMWAERRGGTWGGVLTRTLEDQTKNRRCLQYVYVYTRQHTVVSFFWMVFIPLLMLIWTFLVPFIFSAEMALFEASIQTGNLIDFLLSPGEAWIPMLATGLVSLPLFMTGLWPHVSEARRGQGSKFRFRSTTLLIFLGALMWGVFFNELVIWAMILIWGICTLFWRVRPTGHEMDYIPIFVWLEKDNDKWKLANAAWDYFHYNAEQMSREELEEEDALRKDSNVQLLMDNPWHSLFLGSRDIRGELNMMTGSIVLFIISIGLLWGIFFEDLFAGYTWSNWAMLGIFFMFALSGSIIARFPSSLIKDKSDYTKDGSHLTDEKLRVLWNLGTDEVSRMGRFVCVSKIQNPFSVETEFAAFRDDSR